MFRCVTLAGLIGVGMYTGMKAAYLSTRLRDARRGAQPHLHRAAALRRHRDRPRAAARQLWSRSRRDRATPLYLVGRGTPVTRWASSSTRTRSGFAILQQANRYLYWTPSTAQWVLLAVLAVGVARAPRAAGAARRGTGRRRRSRPCSRSGSSRWNLTGEIGAAAGTNSISRDLGGDARAIRSRGSTTSRTSSRRSISARARPTRTPSGCSSSGTARSSPSAASTARVGGPGPAGAPNLDRGRARSTGPPIRRTPGASYAYAVEDWPCVDFAGTSAARHFYRAGGRPKALASHPADAPEPPARRVHRHLPRRLERGRRQRLLPLLRREGRGWLRIAVSRRTGAARPVRARCTSFSRRSSSTRTASPRSAGRRRSRTCRSTAGRRRCAGVRDAGRRFGARVVVDNKFVPHQIDPSNSATPRTRRPGRATASSSGAADARPHTSR